jgi:hypothetical protein
MRCDTTITKIDADWVDVKNECRNTVNKEPTENIPSSDFKMRLLISEHSPIRLIRVKWRWKSIKSWITVHFARHWLGWDKWIGTRRRDRTGFNRDELEQGELIPMNVCANAQALINVSRSRLCKQAAPETRGYMGDVKAAIFEYESELSNSMVPNCVYRGCCPEFSPCGFWENLTKNMSKEEIVDWDSRYRVYNKSFWNRKRVS